MANTYFQFKQFTIHQDRCAMKVTTDACLFGAWVAKESGVRSPDDKCRDADQQHRHQESGESNENLQSKNVLDIGTGTGLLSLMFAQQHFKSIIDAIEIDHEAYEQAKENVASSPWPDKINVIHSDVKEFQPLQQYDVIVSNPPFYENELKSGSSKKNKAHHDEALLLDDLLTIVKQNLKPKGRFYLLLPYKRNNEIESVVAKNNLAIAHKTLVKQSTQHGYFRIMLCGNHLENEKENLITTEIDIKNENQEYTPAFINLLKDYYLHL